MLSSHEKPSYYSIRQAETSQLCWNISPLVVANQQWHIEQSEALLNMPQEKPTLYWSLAEPTGLVLGFSQKHAILNPIALQTEPAVPIYHRRAGGTAVLVGQHLLSLDVFLPAGHPFILADVVESYRWFGETWVAALQELGVRTRIVSIEEAHAQRALLKQPLTQNYERLMHRACYGTLSSYEVVAGQCKVVGLDMIRRRTGTLLQAGVLLQWDTEPLAYLLGHTEVEQHLLREGLRNRAVGLDTLATRTITANEVREAFEHVLLLL
ncbi:MAG: ligase [Ktedonobacteraceae bacterium]